MGVLVEKNYDSKFYQTIPDLYPAITSFSNKNGKELITKFGNIFVKHHMYNKYSLIVVHRHFDLNPNEILVETFNSDYTVRVALPWNVEGF